MKNKASLLLLFVIIVSFAFLYSKTGTETPVKKEVQPKKEVEPKKKEVVIPKKIISQKKESTKADKIIAIAKESIGLPYKAGGVTKKGFDCSGLVMTSFAKEGVTLPRISYQMAEKGNSISLGEIMPGDLVFFITNPKRPKKINHVGLVTSVSNDTVYFIHSSSKKGVVINSLTDNYYHKTFCKAKRVL